MCRKKVKPIMSCDARTVSYSGGKTKSHKLQVPNTTIVFLPNMTTASHGMLIKLLVETDMSRLLLLSV